MSFRLIRSRLWLCALASALAVTLVKAAEPPGARPRIVVLGDSITAGYGLSKDEAYPALLQARLNEAHLGFEVVNAGLSGDTTAGGLRRVDWVLSAGARVLIVALGGNDGLRGIAPRETASNLTSIMQKARAKVPGLTVLLAGMQMPASMGADFAREFGALFPRVAAENHAILIPYLLQDVGGIEKLNQPDRIHPTPAGQQKVAENVWAVLRPALK